MSFARAALRLSAYHAVKFGTDYQVCDSELVPIDKVAADELVPVITIYTDEASSESKNSEILNQDMQQLVIEVAITQKTKVPTFDPETNVRVDDQTVWIVPPTDAFMELTLDIVCRQIDLSLTDPESPWSEMFRSMCCNIERRESLRGASSEKEDRFAGRQIVYQIKMLREPGLDVREGSVWLKFLELLSNESGYEKPVGLLRDSLKNVENSTLLTELRRNYGLTEDDTRGLMMEEFGDD